MSADLPPLPLRALMDLDGVGLAVLDLRGNVVLANDAFGRLLRDAPVEAGWNAARHFASPPFGRILPGPLAPRPDAWTPVYAGMLQVGAPGGVARSVRGGVYAAGERVLVLLRPDEASYETLSREVLGLNEELADLQRDQARRIEQLRRTEESLRAALAEVRTLSGLLPICAECKNVRNDEGYWERIESYVEKHSRAEFSHGICTACLEKRLAELDAMDPL